MIKIRKDTLCIFRFLRYRFLYILKINILYESICQGDYWHVNIEYFKNLNEIQLKNIERDKIKREYLNDKNIKSLFLWENEIYKFKENLEDIILNELTGKNNENN